MLVFSPGVKASDGEPATLPVTNIYSPLSAGVSAWLDPGKGFWLLDYDEGTLLFFNWQGEREHVLAGEGQGPGETNMATAIQRLGDQVVLYDHLAYRQFHRNGELVVSRRNMPLGARFRLTAGGTFIVENVQLGGEKAPMRAVLDTGTGAYEPIYSWSDKASEAARQQEWHRDASNPAVFYVNPGAVPPSLMVDHTGRFALMAVPAGPTLYIFDTVAQRLLHQVKVPGQRLPMNEEYAEQQYAKIKQRLSRLPMDTTVKLQDADYFPLFRNVRITYDNRILVTKWDPQLKRDHKGALAAEKQRRLLFNWQGQAEPLINLTVHVSPPCVGCARRGRVPHWPRSGGYGHH